MDESEIEVELEEIEEALEQLETERFEEMSLEEFLGLEEEEIYQEGEEEPTDLEELFSEEIENGEVEYTVYYQSEGVEE